MAEILTTGANEIAGSEYLAFTSARKNTASTS
jgi:hypothetical protein